MRLKLSSGVEEEEGEVTFSWGALRVALPDCAAAAEDAAQPQTANVTVIKRTRSSRASFEFARTRRLFKARSYPTPMRCILHPAHPRRAVVRFQVQQLASGTIGLEMSCVSFVV